MSGISQRDERTAGLIKSVVADMDLSDRPASRYADRDPNSNRIYVRESAHGLTKGTCVNISYDGSGRPIASITGAGGKPDGIVDKVCGPNAFWVLFHGFVKGLTGLIENGYQYKVGSSGQLQKILSDTNNDGVTQYSVLFAITDDAGFFNVETSYGFDQKSGKSQYIITDLDSTFKLLTPLAYNGAALVKASASSASPALNQVFGIVVAHLTPGSPTCPTLIQVGGIIQGVDSPVGLPGDTTVASFPAGGTGVIHYLSTTAGEYTATPPASPNAVVPVLVPGPFGTRILDTAVSMPQWTAINGKPATFPPDTSTWLNTLTVNSTDTTDAAAITLAGTVTNEVWTFYEKRPRFNARWLRGILISTSAPTLVTDILSYDGAQWGPRTLLNSKGNILSYDTTDYVQIVAGTALSVVGNATNATAVPTAIAASSADTILGRRGTALTWAKVRASEMDSQQTTGKYVLGTNSGGTPIWLTGEDARDNLDLQNVKCFRTGSTGDTVIYGVIDPVGPGVGVTLRLYGAGVEPSSVLGSVLAQRQTFCSHFYFGTTTGIALPTSMAITADVAMSASIIFDGNGGESLYWTGGSAASNAKTYLDQDIIRSVEIYADSMFPSDGYTGTVTVRDAAGTGTSSLDFTNGILTGYTP